VEEGYISNTAMNASAISGNMHYAPGFWYGLPGLSDEVLLQSSQ